MTDSDNKPFIPPTSFAASQNDEERAMADRLSEGKLSPCCDYEVGAVGVTIFNGRVAFIGYECLKCATLWDKTDIDINGSDLYMPF